MNPALTTKEFAHRYGPWAAIAGASEGTGRAFARQIAGKGISCILIARREGPLAEVAEELRAAYGVECVTAAIDLSAPDAFEQVAAAVGSREIGLFVSNAGADPNGSRFLDREVEVWLSLVRRNVLTVVQCCHHFAGPMRARKRGGLLIVNSGAAYGGGSFLATYSASKAFDLCFAEGLWAELRPHGVDVLSLMMGTTDTPALRALLSEKGLPVPPGVASAEEVAAMGLARLADGPVQNWAQAEDEAGYASSSAAQRRARVLAVDQSSKIVFGED
jgi:short-subunit dehydrogenase